MLNEIYDTMQFLWSIKKIAIRKTISLLRHLFAHRINYISPECINTFALVRYTTIRLTGIICAHSILSFHHHRNILLIHIVRLLTFSEACARIFVATIRGAFDASEHFSSLTFASVPFSHSQYFSYFIGFCRLSADSAICKRGGAAAARFRPYSIFTRGGHGDAGEEIAKPDDVDSVLIGNSVHQISIN